MKTCRPVAPRMMALALTLASLAAAPGGCKGTSDQTPSEVLVEDDRPAPAHVLGVSPLDFRCVMVAPLDEVSAALGVPVKPVSAAFQPPAGTPPPCNYQSTAADKPGAWTFDIDCRDRALDDGAHLMANFATAPGATPVRVGRSGIDHHGVQLLFIDDDAPCYVRVMGPGEAQRLALARLIADRLDPRTAPGRVTYQK